MTTANKITIFRILLVPFFVMQVIYYAETATEWHRWLALGTFALAALSDGVDGYIARRFNQRSELGAILDPLADKLLLVSGVVLLSLHDKPTLDRIPVWLTTTIIGRDVILLLGFVLIYFVCGGMKIRPYPVSKVATVLQMTVVLWILLKGSSRWLPLWMWAAGGCTIISGMLYLIDGVKQLSASPSSAPLPPNDPGASSPASAPTHQPPGA